MSINSNFGIPDDRAKEITKEYSRIIKPVFDAGKMSGSAALDIIMDMNLTYEERTWLAYHVGGINAMILYGKTKGKKIIINW